MPLDNAPLSAVSYDLVEAVRVWLLPPWNADRNQKGTWMLISGNRGDADDPLTCGVRDETCDVVDIFVAQAGPGVRRQPGVRFVVLVALLDGC